MDEMLEDEDGATELGGSEDTPEEELSGTDDNVVLELPADEETSESEELDMPGPTGDAALEHADRRMANDSNAIRAGIFMVYLVAFP